MNGDLADILESTEVTTLATGFVFTEGPLWHPAGYLFFVDLRHDPPLTYKIVPGGKPEVVREGSGGTNGQTFDSQGRVVMCEGDARRVTRMELDGSITPLVERWEGKRLNRPNDVVGRSDGSLYFTDPQGRIEPQDREIGFPGVFRIAPDRLRVSRHHRLRVPQRPRLLAGREPPLCSEHPRGQVHHGLRCTCRRQRLQWPHVCRHVAG